MGILMEAIISIHNSLNAHLPLLTDNWKPAHGSLQTTRNQRIIIRKYLLLDFSALSLCPIC